MIEPYIPSPRVSLIVVNYNGESSLAQTIESLTARTSLPIQTVVLDNASTDGSRQVLQTLQSTYDGMEVVLSDRNRGYAGAVNYVLSRCRGDYVAVLNNDIEAEPKWLEPLARYLDEHPEAAAVSPLILMADGRINAAGQDLHVTGLGFNRALGLPRDSIGPESLQTNGLHGAAFLVRRELLEKVGGMEETGFLYHEDVNLSWRLRALGYEIACVPESVIYHDYRLSMHADKFFLLERNRWLLLLTLVDVTTIVALTPMLLCTELMAWCYAAIRGHSFLYAKARAYGDLWRTRASWRRQRNSTLRQKTVGDLGLLRDFRFSYPWHQFRSLAAERGPPRRPFQAPRTSRLHDDTDELRR